ncbi:MAG: vitamin K epoxide reductase family protein [Drouetiella hepatica Uher 2000/2452]|uniref:Vitamin K epoxide reductase family protein n=1 Tax=Drouetiella hepatica Uher 2000/2452 TaxID=904376 RepID=A0A951Q8V0_9CYAN|nr:vitamin K epoxide reductase family protein [Drouetiella hepatica Uher 2000/2452]
MTSRRRQIPWMYRQSRYLIAAVAVLGALNTGYITATKLFGGETACPTSGCEQVLSGPYATVFGLPLALFGLLAYVGMAAFALVPLAVNPEKERSQRSNLENQTWLLLFAGATAMLVFSAYLMYIMFSQYVALYGAKGLCYYCLASAIFALTLFVLTLFGRDWEDVGQLFFTGILVSMVTIVGTLGVYANVNGSAVANPDAPGRAAPAITTLSGQSELQLARHLTSVGAKMYSAYWCPHCHDQKQLFGKQAVAVLPVVECAPDGRNSQTALCQEKKIEGFPTWEINGKMTSGTQTLQQLADLSGYTGSRDFKN